MKRIILAVMAIATLAVTATSCKKENQDLIIGKWALTSATVNGTIDGQLLLVIALSSPVFEFKADDKTVSITTTIPALVEGMTETVTTTPLGTWNVSGSNLTITPSQEATGSDFGDISGTILIKKLTSKDMQLQSTRPNEETGKNDVLVLFFTKK